MQIARVADRAADNCAIAIHGVTKQAEWNRPQMLSIMLQHSHRRDGADIDRDPAAAIGVRSEIARGAVADRSEDLRIL